MRENLRNKQTKNEHKTLPLGSDAEPGRNPKEERGGGEESQAGRNRSYAGVRFPSYRTGKKSQTGKIRLTGKKRQTGNFRRTGKIRRDR